MSLLDAEQLAKELRLSERTIHQWTREGKIPCLSIGGKFRRYELEQVLEALRRERLNKTATRRWGRAQGQTG